jgi:hypothetical protein
MTTLRNIYEWLAAAIVLIFYYLATFGAAFALAWLLNRHNVL